MRIVLYEDFDDMFEENEELDPSTIFLSHFSTFRPFFE